MGNLVNFIVRHNHWLLFILLETISLTLLVRFNAYQQGTFFTNANTAIGYINDVESSVYGYFNLRQQNQQLAERNIELYQQITALKDAHKIDSALCLENICYGAPIPTLHLIRSEVVNNSINSANNYFALDRGTDDGVQVGQGVLSYDGIAGIVYLTAEHHSVAISLLHSQTRISCKLADTGYFGTLVWDQRNSKYMYLDGIPHHAKWKRGMRVVTSGYSDAFPEGLLVGHVKDAVTASDGVAYRMQVELSTDFGSLNDAFVIDSIPGSAELKELVSQINENE